MSYYKQHMRQFFGGSRPVWAGPFFNADDGGRAGGEGADKEGDSGGEKGGDTPDEKDPDKGSDKNADKGKEGDAGKKAKDDEGVKNDEPDEDAGKNPDADGASGQEVKATEIALPEGATYDEAIGTRFEGLLKEVGITDKAMAQKLADFHFEQLAAAIGKTDESIKAAEKARVEAAEKARVEKNKAEEAAWLEACKEDKEIGGHNWERTQTRVKDGVKALGAEKAYEFLDNVLGVAGYPEIVRMLAKAGELTGEDGLGGGGSAGRRKSDREVFYGDSAAE